MIINYYQIQKMIESLVSNKLSKNIPISTYSYPLGNTVEYQIEVHTDYNYANGG